MRELTTALLAGLLLVAPATSRADEGIGAPPEEDVSARRGVEHRGHLLSGWLLFGASYGLAVAGGITMASMGETQGLLLLIPVVGPGIEAGVGNVESWARLVLASWVLVEAVGAVLLGSALAISASRERGGRHAAAPRPRGPRVQLAPTGPEGTPGLSVAGLF